MSSIALLVEEPQVARILTHKLQREGHTVDVLQHRSQLPKRVQFDLAIVQTEFADAEVSYGVRNGWLAMVNASELGLASLRMMQLGAAGIISKPFKPSEVAQQVAVLARLQA